MTIYLSDRVEKAIRNLLSEKNQVKYKDLQRTGLRALLIPRPYLHADEGKDFELMVDPLKLDSSKYETLNPDLTDYVFHDNLFSFTIISLDVYETSISISHVFSMNKEVLEATLGCKTDMFGVMYLNEPSSRAVMVRPMFPSSIVYPMYQEDFEIFRAELARSEK